ncbi:site-specific integrase [Photobacterium alginatilyticum]|uniref:Site-specific integrase n=1 Tax=Photobacterium alginatilyticum TaxID=1775171 RepID=A0ABW9YMZ0_9GAMM|nr:site-specific integrase [Photobacterium alginatilyticum]NBI54573.1 site-specific integrase [Photobacterium alginatilyticum]
MKRPPQQQLYRKLTEVTLPESIQYFRSGNEATYRIEQQYLPVAAFVRWPSGKPCLPVNMYLLYNGYNWTGDSVLTTASKLSELVRYCAHGRATRQPCGFGDLTDNDIGRLIEKLCTDVYMDDPSQRLRNNNTVRAIMQTILSFLVWYQDNLYLKPGRLIGSSGEGAAIGVTRKKNSHNNRYYWHHRYLPQSVSTDPKLPMGTIMIEDIEMVIEDLYEPDAYPEPARRRFGKNESLFDAYRDYITARRDFMLLMMRKTGLRPEEMVQMSLKANRHSIGESQPVLILPTLKRRQLDPPLRRFPITPKIATRVRLYLKAHQKWLQCCEERNPELAESDSLFLSTEPGNLGAAVAKSGLDKDFENLCNRAGYRNHQACFSMFRHRFITDLVLLHLKELNKGKTEVNKHDYRMVLEKVREKTGHKSIDTLWHYIDLAYDMEGVWNPVNQAIRRLQATEELKHDLNQLRRQLRNSDGSQLACSQVIDLVTERLSQIIGDAEQAGLDTAPTG